MTRVAGEMSEIFEQYEVEFKELADGLAGKVAAVGSLSGELRAGKVAEVEGEVAEGEALLRRMELEARSLAGGAKAPLLARVKEHRAGLAKVLLNPNKHAVIPKYVRIYLVLPSLRRGFSAGTAGRE